MIKQMMRFHQFAENLNQNFIAENTAIKNYLLDTESKTRDLKINLNEKTLKLQDVQNEMMIKKQL